MSCKNEFFQEQCKVSKNSIQQQINHFNLNDYICVYDYEGEHECSYIKDSTIYLTSNDDKNNTYDKTIECFDVINKSTNFDYIFRTNTSTFINVKLLYEFIEFMKPKDTLWCSELYSTFDVKCPELYDIYPRGNGLLLSKQLIDLILEHKKKKKNTSLVNIMFDNQNMISDDACIGTILNMYYGNDSLNHIKSFTHGWYKSYDPMMNGKGNKICNWNNENISYNFIDKFITIQIKDYTDKANIQQERFDELTDIIISNEYDKNIIMKVLTYSFNPSVFLGYFVNPHYVDYITWYQFHFNNKLK